MNETIVAVIGTLLGTGLGVAGSYAVQRASHDREAEERLNALRRQVYVEWLTRSHEIYQAVKSAWAGAPVLSTADRWERLQAISPMDAQAALESVRLVAGDGVAVAGAAIWAHLRGENVAVSGAGDRKDYKWWQESYWSHRRDFIDEVRVELGLDALDWRLAGVGPARRTARRSQAGAPDPRAPRPPR